MEKVIKLLDMVLEDWEHMQHTSGDEGADFAERFEMHFYQFSAQLKVWIKSRKQIPKTVEDAEELPEIKKIIHRLPEPLYLNFSLELEEIIDDIDTYRVD